MPNLQDIKLNTNNFSFIDTVASLANNKEYRSGYVDLLHEKFTDKSYFWTALSAVGEEVGSVIYENVLNYINNVANMNVCKLKALTSIAKVLGVTEFAVLKNLNTIPEDVLKFMDIFSINKKYLFNIRNFNIDFVRDMLSTTIDKEMLSDAEEAFRTCMGSKDDPNPPLSALSSYYTVIGSVSEEKYEKYVEEVFYKLLSLKLFQTYGNDPSDYIYLNLASQGNLSSTNNLSYTRRASSGETRNWKGDLNLNQYWTTSPDTGTEASNSNFIYTDYPKNLYRYKKALNVDPGFNESKIVDDIEDGLDFLDNYQGGELSVLNLEIAERAKVKFSKEKGYESKRLDTRYSYYNEQEVLQYVRFIDDTYVLKQTKAATAESIEEISASFLDWTPYFLSNGVSPYFLDPNYSDVTISSNTSLMSNISLQKRICENTPALSDVFVNHSFYEFVSKYYGNAFSESVESNSYLSALANGNLLRIVARILKDICLAIVDIREKLKTQAQRNYMTGTKLLIEYILDEYLINTLINTYGTDPALTKSQRLADTSNFPHQTVGVQIVEYDDTTEYFNIGEQNAISGQYSYNVNSPYFKDLENGGFTGSRTGVGLTPETIREFYLSSLNIEGNVISDEETFYDFMSAVYEVGITKTYVGKYGALEINKDHLEDNLCVRIDLDQISSAYNFTKEDYENFKNSWYLEDADGFRSLNYSVLSDYMSIVSSNLSVIENDFARYNLALSSRLEQQQELFLKYHGSDIAYYPWYNYKNVDFPTFQAHPYLYNFVEHDDFSYPIENSFYGTANEDLIYELQSEHLSIYLGELGNLKRIWRNSGTDYSGYKSRYENSMHQYGASNSSGLYSVTHYDGIFYPPAIELYKKYVDGSLKETIIENGKEKILSGFELLSAHMITYPQTDYYYSQRRLDIPQISSMWHYYSHLGLTLAERKRITEQLTHLSADLLEMSDAKWRELSGSGEEPYDVYRYALDYNNNSLMLLKKYGDDSEDSGDDSGDDSDSSDSGDDSGEDMIDVLNPYFEHYVLYHYEGDFIDNVVDIYDENPVIQFCNLSSNITGSDLNDISIKRYSAENISNKSLEEIYRAQIQPTEYVIEPRFHRQREESYVYDDYIRQNYRWTWRSENYFTYEGLLIEFNIRLWTPVSITSEQSISANSNELLSIALNAFFSNNLGTVIVDFPSTPGQTETISYAVKRQNGEIIEFLYGACDSRYRNLFTPGFENLNGYEKFKRQINWFNDNFSSTYVTEQYLGKIPKPTTSSSSNLRTLKKNKKSVEKPTYLQKRNSLGQLWLRYNSHPIGFPAFLNGSLSSYSNIEITDSNNGIELNHDVLRDVLETEEISEYGSGHAVNNVYDFELASNGSYLVYAIKNPSEDESFNEVKRTFKNSVTLASKIVQQRTQNYSDPNAETTKYFLAKFGPTFLYPNNDGVPNNYNLFNLTGLHRSDYEFDGYFQNGKTIYAGYFKRNKLGGLLNSVSLNAIEYPSAERQSYNRESSSFAFENTRMIKMLDTKFAKTLSNAQIRLGYDETNSFALVVANEVLNRTRVDGKDIPQYVQDFIGYNNKLSSQDESLSSGFGFVDYYEATSGVWNSTDLDKNQNSFDRFDKLISIYDVSKAALEDMTIDVDPQCYALNSDASYVPLYYGVNGQNLYYRLKNKDTDELISYNKDWHKGEDNVLNTYVPRQSIELLGYSYQDLDKLAKDKENTIYEDEDTGKYTSVEAKNLINSSLRVYEDFLSNNFVFTAYNEGFLWNVSDSNKKEISIDIDLLGLTPETSSDFNMLLLNCSTGQDRNPILAGPFSYETVSSVYYDNEETENEAYLLSTGYKPEENLFVVGTPNPFDYKDASFSLDYTNHILNVSNLSCSLVYDELTRKYVLVVELTRNKEQDFSVQSEILQLFIYKNTLEQFEKYHYMEPTTLWPNNAAMSVWNLPWKDKNHAELYVDGWDAERDGWKNGYADYLDKRLIDPKDRASDSYKNDLKSKAVKFAAAVGHLPLSAYDSNNSWKLSIDENDPRLSNETLMENIELSSLTSFNGCYYLSTGQITWKISEEDEFRYLRTAYPPSLIDVLLYDKFNGCNKSHNGYNVFNLSTTYIFQLEDPLSIANKIGTIAVPIGSTADDFILVYEDYLSDQVSTDIGGTNFMNYVEMIYDPKDNASLVQKDITQEEVPSIISTELHEVNSNISNLTDINEAYLSASKYGYYSEDSEKNNKTGTFDYYLMNVTEKDISDYLKLYVNWRKYSNEENEEIELFFNMQNLFMSPYSYKTKNGRYSVEYKPNTYLRLKSGQDGYLYVILQFKYYDSIGNLCGIRDLPILTYHVYNVSDDKPKFLITKTFEIDNRDGKYTYLGNDDSNEVYVIVNRKTYNPTDIVNTSNGQMEVSSTIGYEGTVSCDLYLNTTLEVLSPIPLKYLSVDLVYERGRIEGNMDSDYPEFVFEPTISHPGEFAANKQRFSVSLPEDVVETNFEFTMLYGASMNNEMDGRIFPIEILKASGEDIFGNKPKFIFINGYVEINNNDDSGWFLARELNEPTTPPNERRPVKENSENHVGWILEETNGKKFRMYYDKYNMKVLTETRIPLVTTGFRNSRFDKYNNLFIIAENSKR